MTLDTAFKISLSIEWIREARGEDSKVLYMSVPLIHPTYTLDPYRFVVESSQATT